MEIKILQVFYGKDGLPYKDKDRQVHFPIAGTGFLGASNTTKIKFYYDELDNLDETSWVAVSKLPNGKVGSRVLESYLDEELNEHYALLELDNYYTQYKGDVFISLQGYQGGVDFDYDEENSQYEIHGTPTIAATGSIKFTINYANQFVGSGETDNINFQRILAALGTKLGMRAYSEHVEELPSEGSPDVFYVVNDEPNNPNIANIYVWNENTKHYIWVGDNTLDLGNYYTREQGVVLEEKMVSLEDELESLSSGAPSGTFDTLSDLETADPNHSKIYLVLEDGKWYYYNTSTSSWTAGGQYLASGGAVPETRKIAGITLENNISANELEDALPKTQAISITYGDNLFNPKTAVTGKYIHSQYDLVNEVLNIEGTNVAFAYNKAEIENGKTYTISLASYTCFITDENNAILQKINTPPYESKTVTVNAVGAKYLYVNYRFADVPTDKYMIVEGSSLPSVYEKHIEDVRFNEDNPYIAMTLDELQEAMPKTKVISIQYGENLFNPENAVEGSYMSSPTGYDNIGEYLTRKTNAEFANNLIPIENGKTYTFSLSSYTCFICDEDLKILQKITNGTTTVTVNAVGAKYLAVNYRFAVVSTSNYMVVEGSTLPSEYIPYIKNVYFNKNNPYFSKENVIVRTNLVSTVTLNEGKYYDAANYVGANVTLNSNDAFDCVLIPVEYGKTYSFTGASHVIILVSEQMKATSLITWNDKAYPYSVTINDLGTKYLAISFRTANYPANEFMVVEGEYPSKYFATKLFAFNGSSIYKEDEKNEYIVDINGSGDYTSFTQCLRDLANNKKPKTIKILSGTYDIFEEYGGAAYIATLGDGSGLNWRDVSVMIPENTHVVGIGQVTLKWEPDPADIVSGNIAFLFSTVNLSANNITLENLTITCSNGRYCIHDECGVRWEAVSAQFQKATHKYINIRAEKKTYTYGTLQCYGGGQGDENTYIFENCYFKSAYRWVWTSHTNSNNTQGTGGSNFYFNNCIFETSDLSEATIEFINGDFFNNKNNVTFNNCYISGDINLAYKGTLTDRVQTYALTLLKTTYDQITTSGSYASEPFTPAIFN